MPTNVWNPDFSASRIAHAVKNQLAGRAEFDAEYYRRRQSYTVHVYTDRSPTVVLIQGPEYVQDDTLRAALREYGYKRHDYIHRPGSGRTKETVAHIYD